ncbi:unnamed protein product [Lampetra fluviatilis]
MLTAFRGGVTMSQGPRLAPAPSSDSETPRASRDASLGGSKKHEPLRTRRSPSIFILRVADGARCELNDLV